MKGYVNYLVYTTREYCTDLIFLQTCPREWNRIFDSCFIFPPLLDRVNKSTAVARCKELSPLARLFQPKNKWINDLLFKWLDNNNADPAYGDGTWIGISDVIQENTFVYDSSNEEVTFVNWLSGQPNGDTDQNCVTIDDGAKWRDIECDAQRSFLCELPLI